MMLGSTTMLAWASFGGLAFGAQTGVTLTPAQIAAQTAASRENSDFRYGIYLGLLACLPVWLFAWDFPLPFFDIVKFAKLW